MIIIAASSAIYVAVAIYMHRMLRALKLPRGGRLLAVCALWPLTVLLSASVVGWSLLRGRRS